MTNWEEIQREWETSEKTFKQLAEEFGAKDSTIRSRKNREKWQRNETKKTATQRATKKKSVATIEPVIENDGLNDMQRLFCIYYIKSLNQTMAAIKAGYARNRAHITGSELVRNSKVAAEIRRLKGEMHQEIFIDAMDVLNKYIQIAFADITDFVTFGSIEKSEHDPETGAILLDDNFKPITYKHGFVEFKESDEVDGTLITEVKLGKDGVSVKLADKMKALEMLTKYFDLLSDTDKEKLQSEKLKIETEFTKQRVELLRGLKKDTGMLDSLINAIKSD